jgi:hypothetical protein
MHGSLPHIQRRRTILSAYSATAPKSNPWIYLNQLAVSFRGTLPQKMEYPEQLDLNSLGTTYNNALA